MTERNTNIDPLIEVVGHEDGGATITARLKFDVFEDAMKFNRILVAFLKREMRPRADSAHDD